jgi:hypothetical protein
MPKTSPRAGGQRKGVKRRVLYVSLPDQADRLCSVCGAIHGGSQKVDPDAQDDRGRTKKVGNLGNVEAQGDRARYSEVPPIFKA